jgi:hypothetical protein
VQDANGPSWLDWHIMECEHVDITYTSIALTPAVLLIQWFSLIGHYECDHRSNAGRLGSIVGSSMVASSFLPQSYSLSHHDYYVRISVSRPGIGRHATSGKTYLLAGRYH